MNHYEAWAAFKGNWANCTLCPLYKTRFLICLSRGDIPADVLFIGEAPGDAEDVLGEPFVPNAPAGEILQRIINKLQETHTFTYAITNIVCCRPPDPDDQFKFRQPTEEEALTCRPRLLEFIDLVQPQLIVLLGKVATKYAPTLNPGVVRVIDLVHPSAIARSENDGPLMEARFRNHLKQALMETGL